MYKSTIFYLTLLLSSFTYSLSAQKWSYTAQIGTTAYLGDLSEKLACQPNENRIVVGGALNYTISDVLNVRLSAISGRLSGIDGENSPTAWRKLRGFSFQTPFVETSITAEFDVLKAISGNKHAQNDLLSTYFVLGAGMSYISPSVDFNEKKSFSDAVNLDKQAVYARNQVVIPVGFAVKWRMNKTATLRFETVGRKTFSDYFDGISKSAGPRYNDYYMTTMIGFEKKLSWGLKGWKKYQFFNIGAYCPRFK